MKDCDGLANAYSGQSARLKKLGEERDRYRASLLRIIRSNSLHEMYDLARAALGFEKTFPELVKEYEALEKL